MTQLCHFSLSEAAQLIATRELSSPVTMNRDRASALVSVPNFTAHLEEGLKLGGIGIVRHFYDRDELADLEVNVALEQEYIVYDNYSAILTTQLLSSNLSNSQPFQQESQTPI